MMTSFTWVYAQCLLRPATYTVLFSSKNSQFQFSRQKNIFFSFLDCELSTCASINFLLFPLAIRSILSFWSNLVHLFIFFFFLVHIFVFVHSFSYVHSFNYVHCFNFVHSFNFVIYFFQIVHMSRAYRWKLSILFSNTFSLKIIIARFARKLVKCKKV